MDNNIKKLILEKFPYPLAALYAKYLSEEHLNNKLRIGIRLFEYSLRFIAIILISEFTSNINQINSHQKQKVINSLWFTFHNSNPGFNDWIIVTKTILKAFYGKQNLLMVPELYNLQWEIEGKNHLKRDTLTVFDWIKNNFRNLDSHAPIIFDNEALKNDINIIDEKIVFLFKELSFLGDYHFRLENPDQKNEGWYLFSKNNENHLFLNPFVISGEIKADQPIFFEKYLINNIEYVDIFEEGIITKFFDEERIEPNLRESIVHEYNISVIQNFENRFLNYIKSFSDSSLDCLEFTFDNLRKISKKVSENQFRHEFIAFNNKHYFNRISVTEHYNKFLDSDKPAMVIVGESGVGKSHFIANQYQSNKANQNIVMVIIKAKFVSPNKQFFKTLMEEFQTQVEFYDGRKKLNNIFGEIKRILNERRKFIIFIDGLNENIDPKYLYREIEKFIKDIAYLNSIKVVITSQPELWRSMTRSIHIDTSFFYESGMEKFKIETQLSFFSNKELINAFHYFKNIYNINNSWEEIPEDLKQILKNPFYFEVVAATHINKSITDVNSPFEIIEEYLNRLEEHNYLDAQDLDLLRNEIIPLMVSEKQIQNFIPRKELSRNSSKILNTTLNSLLDQSKLFASGILQRQFRALEEQVEFKHEILLDYFGGEYLFKQLSQLKDIESYGCYKDILLEIETKGFIFGIVKFSIIREIVDRSNSQLFIELCYIENDFIRDLLISIALTLFNSNKDKTLNILELLLRNKNNFNHLKIAARIATKNALKDYILKLSEIKSDQLQAFLAKQIFYLWKDHPNDGFEIIYTIAKNIKGRFGFPKLQPLLLCATSSMLILANCTPDERITSRLKSIWLSVFSGSILSKVNKQKIIMVKFFEVILRMIFSYVLFKSKKSTKVPDFLIFSNTAFTKLSYVKWKFPTSLYELSTFFENGAEKKLVFLNLLKEIKSINNESLMIKEIIQKISQHRDMLSVFLISLFFTRNFIKKPYFCFDLIEDAYNSAIKLSPAGPMIPYLRLLFFSLSRNRMVFTKEMAKRNFDMVIDAFKKTSGIFVTDTGVSYNRTDIFRAAICYYTYHQNFPQFIPAVISDLFDNHIKTLECEIKLIADFEVDYEWRNINIDAGFALYKQIYEKLYLINDSQKFTQISDYFIDSLALLYQYHPFEVESFLYSLDIDEKCFLRIRNTEPEGVGDLLGRYTAILSQGGIILEIFPELDEQLFWLLEKAYYSKDAIEWFILIIKWVVNIISNSEIFNLDNPKTNSQNS
jgi:hypothetical protein